MAFRGHDRSLPIEPEAAQTLEQVRQKHGTETGIGLILEGGPALVLLLCVLSNALPEVLTLVTLS